MTLTIPLYANVQKQSAARDALVVDYMQALLVEMANAPEPMVGRIDGNLTELISAFPFLLFDADLIGTLLEIVNVFEGLEWARRRKKLNTRYEIRHTKWYCERLVRTIDWRGSSVAERDGLMKRLKRHR